MPINLVLMSRLTNTRVVRVSESWSGGAPSEQIAGPVRVPDISFYFRARRPKTIIAQTAGSDVEKGCSFQDFTLSGIVKCPNFYSHSFGPRRECATIV
jgi:hypothetical protein